ncbi:unnamed protein product [Phytomonas sp. Hart1]|nr:unnamed protein product [Phytomonas sp. Hart1]|eukprot:CCW71504.1 unnamed protein product [Phytomonas sp. isolate Hart1]
MKHRRNIKPHQILRSVVLSIYYKNINWYVKKIKSDIHKQLLEDKSYLHQTVIAFRAAKNSECSSVGSRCASVSAQRSGVRKP